MPGRTFTRWLAALLLALGTVAALAHELQDNRLTLVQRDDRHLSLTFFLRYAEVLQRALAPGQPAQAFAMVHAAMPPAEWQQVLSRVQRQFEQQTQILLPNGTPLALSNWQWPDAASVQARLQEQAMQAVVGAGPHDHELLLELRAEVRSPQALNTVSVRLPPTFGPVLVVSYRPRQVWARPQAPAVAVSF